MNLANEMSERNEVCITECLPTLREGSPPASVLPAFTQVMISLQPDLPDMRDSRIFKLTPLTTQGKNTLKFKMHKGSISVFLRGKHNRQRMFASNNEISKLMAHVGKDCQAAEGKFSSI